MTPLQNMPNDVIWQTGDHAKNIFYPCIPKYDDNVFIKLKLIKTKF